MAHHGLYGDTCNKKSDYESRLGKIVENPIYIRLNPPGVLLSVGEYLENRRASPTLLPKFSARCT